MTLSTTNARQRVAIIGGGISGLSAAWALKKAGVDYVLLEASDRLGGKVMTEQVDGFVIEAGPELVSDTKTRCDPSGVRTRH